MTTKSQNDKNTFVLLKRTYPISTYDRYCDGYVYIMDNSTVQERKQWGILDDDLPQTIKENEKYIYEVGKQNGKFKTMSISTKNFKIIREFFFGLKDE